MRLKWLIIFLFLVNTGSIQAQLTDTSSADHRVTLHGLIAPSSLLIAGIALNGNQYGSVKMRIARYRNEQFSSFHSRADDFLQFSPIAIAYGLEVAGVKSQTDIADRTAILLKGEFMMLASVFTLKYATHQTRPDLSDNKSFPSGHTAQAFAGATFLSEEYKSTINWMPYAAYSIAGSVGILRIANNKHYISDTIFGAGLGILSMKVAYWTHQYKWKRSHKCSIST
jgi:membrane-associated phospholipid phosphatase